MMLQNYTEALVLVAQVQMPSLLTLTVMGIAILVIFILMEIFLRDNDDPPDGLA